MKSVPVPIEVCFGIFVGLFRFVPVLSVSHDTRSTVYSTERRLLLFWCNRHPWSPICTRPALRGCTKVKTRSIFPNIPGPPPPRPPEEVVVHKLLWEIKRLKAINYWCENESCQIEEAVNILIYSDGSPIFMI